MQEQEKQASVPYFIHEGIMTRMERLFKITVAALVTALVVAVMALVINDTLWRKHCDSLEQRIGSYEVEHAAGVHQQPDGGPD